MHTHLFGEYATPTPAPTFHVVPKGWHGIPMIELDPSWLAGINGGKPVGDSTKPHLTAGAILSVIDSISNSSRDVVSAPTMIVWRGQSDIDWGLASSLERQVARRGGPCGEAEIVAAENIVWKAATKGRRNEIAGRVLARAEFFALMQHRTSGTRLIDFTQDPRVALWLAASEAAGRGCDFIECTSSERSADGVLLAVPVYSDEPLAGGAEFKGPSGWDSDQSMTEIVPTKTFLYRPYTLDARIAAQRAVFVFGRKPKRETAISVDLPGWGFGSPARLVPWVRSGGQPPRCGAFAIRIPSNAKTALTRALTAVGVSNATLFPDVDGFAIEARRATLCAKHGVTSV